MQPAVHYDDLTDALARIGFTHEPAEYHGTLCGALCVRRPEQIDPLKLLAVDDSATLRDDATARQALAKLCRESLDALEDSEMIFAPLLPADEAELAARVRALAAWCEGFLFGLATKTAGLRIDALSEDAREIIRDFTEFTRASLEAGDDASIEEDAYAELVEYIRVGAQLIFMEFRPAPVPDPAESKQLH